MTTQKKIAYLANILLAFSALSATSQGLAKPKGRHYQALVQQIEQARDDIRQADKELVSQMHSVNTSLRLYFGQRGKRTDLLNLSPEENVALAKYLTSQIEENPFKNLSPNQDTRIKIKLEPSLSYPQLDKLRKQPPEKWRESPGTITIIHNGYDCLIIWGAGYEHRPIKTGSLAKILSLQIKF